MDERGRRDRTAGRPSSPPNPAASRAGSGQASSTVPGATGQLRDESNLPRLESTVGEWGGRPDGALHDGGPWRLTEQVTPVFRVCSSCRGALRCEGRPARYTQTAASHSTCLNTARLSPRSPGPLWTAVSFVSVHDAQIHTQIGFTRLTGATFAGERAPFPAFRASKKRCP